MKPVVLAVVLLVLPTAALAATPQAVVTGPSASWTDGRVPASSFLALDNPGAGAFEATAQRLHVRVVTAESYTTTPNGEVAFSPSWTTDEDDFTAVALQGDVGRARAHLFVVPVTGEPAPLVVAPCGEATAADATVPFKASSYIETPNPNPSVDLGRALSLAPCGQAVSVCGTFTVILWDQDASGQAAEGTVRVETGQLARPGEPDARPVLGRAQQAYLTFTKGCFTTAPKAGLALFTEGLALETTNLTLRQARGTLTGVAVAGDVLLGGRLRLDLQRQDSAVSASVQDGLTSATVDGRPVALAVTTTAPRLPVAGWLAGLLALAAMAVAVAVGVWLRRHNNPARLRFRAEVVAEAGRWPRVVGLADRVLQREPNDYRALALRAMAWTSLQAHDRALADIETALPLTPHGPLRAFLAIEACRTLVWLGREREAVDKLRLAYLEDLEVVRAALEHPEIRRLYQSPGYA